MVNPLPVEAVKAFAAKHEKIYVIEELDPVIEKHCRALDLDVIGKEAFAAWQYTAPMIAKAILGKKTPELLEAGEQTPVRPPVMCRVVHTEGCSMCSKSSALR